MKIAICDDEANVRENLREMIERYIDSLPTKNSILILEFGDGGQLLDYLEYRDKSIDILFLDILMNNINGIHVAQEIRKFDMRMCILFLTSIKNYVFEGYKVKALRYLIKPITFAKLSKELEFAISEFHRFENGYIIEINEFGLYRIFFEDILYFVTEGRYTSVITKNETITSNKRMKQRIAEVSDSFYRIHESYIVNMDYVQKIEKNTLSLVDGTELPISKSRRKLFVRRLSEYFGNKL